MSHDLLLEWASERADGTWSQFRAAHEWLFDRPTTGRWKPSPGWSARTLATLGHIEIDWTDGTWAASAPVITLLPSAGGHALLTGGRTRTLIDQLEPAWEQSSDLYVFDFRQRDAPRAILIAAEDEAAIEALATRLGVAYEFSVSDRVSRLLPTLDSYLALSKSTPGVAAPGYGVDRFDPDTLKWGATDSDRTPGLYRYDMVGRPAYRLLDHDGTVYAPDMPTGIYAALSRWGENVLSHEPDATNGQLVVPAAAPLPTLQARAAALSSGLAPTRDKWTDKYWNVPHQVAERVARSLDQTLALPD